MTQVKKKKKQGKRLQKSKTTKDKMYLNFFNCIKRTEMLECDRIEQLFGHAS